MIIGCFAFPIARRVAADRVSIGTRPPPDLNVRACVLSRLLLSRLVSRTCLLRSALKLYYCLYNILYMYIINGDWWCFLSFYFFCVLYPIDFPIHRGHLIDREFLSHLSFTSLAPRLYRTEHVSACSSVIHCRAPHSPATTAASYLQIVLRFICCLRVSHLSSPHHVVISLISLWFINSSGNCSIGCLQRIAYD